VSFAPPGRAGRLLVLRGERGEPDAAGVDAAPVLSRLNGGFQCRIVQGTTDKNRGEANGPPTGQVYLGTDNATASFDYLFIVDEP
jgi:hypothetical protein